MDRRLAGGGLCFVYLPDSLTISFSPLSEALDKAIFTIDCTMGICTKLPKSLNIATRDRVNIQGLRI